MVGRVAGAAVTIRAVLVVAVAQAVVARVRAEPGKGRVIRRAPQAWCA